MIEKTLLVYSMIFSRKIFYKLHKLLFLMSLKGMGMLNYQNFIISGEKSFIDRLVASGRIKSVIDIGSNEGAYSVIFKKADPSIVVYAFEPHPKTFLRLKDNVQGLGVELENCAVGREAGIVKFYDHEGHDGSEHASIYKEVLTGFHGSTVSEYDVRMTTVGQIFLDRKIQEIDLLKIDTEGNEYAVLEGARSALKNNRIKIVHLEFNALNVYSRTFFKDIAGILENYSIFRLLQDGLVPIGTYDPVFCEIFAFQNLIAIRKDVLADFKQTLAL